MELDEKNTQMQIYQDPRIDYRNFNLSIQNMYKVFNAGCPITHSTSSVRHTVYSEEGLWLRLSTVGQGIIRLSRPSIPVVPINSMATNLSCMFCSLLFVGRCRVRSQDVFDFQTDWRVRCLGTHNLPTYIVLPCHWRFTRTMDPKFHDRNKEEKASTYMP